MKSFFICLLVVFCTFANADTEIANKLVQENYGTKYGKTNDSNYTNCSMKFGYPDEVFIPQVYYKLGSGRLDIWGHIPGSFFGTPIYLSQGSIEGEAFVLRDRNGEIQKKFYLAPGTFKVQSMESFDQIKETCFLNSDTI